jgi:hypothetical protein
MITQAWCAGKFSCLAATSGQQHSKGNARWRCRSPFQPPSACWLALFQVSTPNLSIPPNFSLSLGPPSWSQVPSLRTTLTGTDVSQLFTRIRQVTRSAPTNLSCFNARRVCVCVCVCLCASMRTRARTFNVCIRAQIQILFACT